MLTKYCIAESVLDEDEKTGQPHNITSTFSFLGGLIPYLGKIGSYWKFRAPESKTQSIMSSEGNLIVLSASGKVYLANINVDEGGEAILESTTNLNNSLRVHDSELLPEKN